MSDPTPDRVEAGSAEIPEVLRTLAGVLPQFEGADLESQLQTYDAFLGFLSPAVRPQIAILLRDAAARAKSPPARERIEAAAKSVLEGGRAAEPYNHDKAMQEYQQAFREANPPAPEPPPDAPPDEEDAETDHDTNSQDEDEADGDEDDGEGDDDAPEQAAPHPHHDAWSASAQKPREKRTHPKILEQLNRIEAEMKHIGYWSANPPDLLAAAERGELKSYLDAPTFELWLQALFLPRARQAAQDDQLPAQSQVGEMARRQYDYMSYDPKAEHLLNLLRRFDDLIIEAAPRCDN